MNDQRGKRTTQGRRIEANRILTAIDSFISGLSPNDKVPNHIEFMRLLGAGERGVREALNELRRRGKIVSQQGRGTFLANPSHVPDIPPRRIIAVTTPDESYFDRCIQVLFHNLATNGFSLTCCIVSPNNAVKEIDKYAGIECDYIVTRYKLDDVVSHLLHAHKRVVVLGAPTTNTALPTPCIHSNHAIGSALVVEHLVDLGHRRLAFLGHHDTAQERSMRWNGHNSAIRQVQERGIPIKDRPLLLSTLHEWERHPGLAASYFKSSSAPTAVIAWNDHMAIRLLSVLMQAGIRVPNDVSVVGYDHLPESTRSAPPLTTIDHDIMAQTRMALDMISRSGPISPDFRFMTTPQLVIGKSTAPKRNAF
jgi:DNA-binding LacI/PurR family transcriptional regulator